MKDKEYRGAAPPEGPLDAAAIDRYLQVAKEIAQQAGVMLLDEFQKPRHVEYKADGSTVTRADRRSEEFLVDRLRTHFPQHAIVAEEGSGQETPSDYCWYVDPLDGTTNFAHGFPAFCVSVALARGKEILIGVVHDPTRAETFHAVRGEGAWLNQKRIHVSGTEKVEEGLFATGFTALDRHSNENLFYYQRFSQNSHSVRHSGSAALDLCYVACGRLDGFWEFNLKPWDVAAGWLLVQEAGGVVSDLQGLPYYLDAKEITASNGCLHHELLRAFSEVAERVSRQKVF